MSQAGEDGGWHQASSWELDGGKGQDFRHVLEMGLVEVVMGRM